MPITVYLDTQDYSNMANAKRHVNEPDLPELLEKLRQLRDSGRVTFVFSGVSVAEALPMQPSDVDLARRQVSLLRELCGDNALVSSSRLIQREIFNLSKSSCETVQASSGKHDWIPEGLALALNATQEGPSIREEAVSLLKAKKISPRAVSMALKPTMKIVRDARFDSRLKKIERGEFFYIKPEFHDVVLRLAVEEATLDEKNEAILESWNDLEWVIGLYEKLPDLVNWYRDLIRHQSASSADALRKFVAFMDHKEVPVEWKSKGWRQFRDEHLMSLIPAVSLALNIRNENTRLDRIEERCPGMTTEAGVIASLTWAYVQGGMKKEIINSATADAMHAAYAPYVDVFRADRSMAPHVVTALNGSKTRVVGDRKKLIETIEDLLRERELG